MDQIQANKFAFTTIFFAQKDFGITPKQFNVCAVINCLQFFGYMPQKAQQNV